MFTLSGFPQNSEQLKKDLIAGSTVAIVALPLAIGFGVTSGMTPAAGIATAVIAGFLTALFGSSKYQVSGPTGAMAVVLIPVIQNHGVSIIPLLGIMSGVIILLLGLFKAGTLINKIPEDVVEGFTLGIAVIIALQQIPLALNVPKGEGERTIPTAINTIRNIELANLSFATIAVLCLTLFIKFNLVHLIRRLKISWYVPASFSSIIFATAFVAIFGLDVVLVGEIPRSVFSLAEIDFSAWNLLLLPALSVALLAAIESLLAARVADQLADPKSPMQFEPNQELVGQSIGSTVASVFGGMPSTGAIARTNVNVRAEAQTKLAAMVHSVVLLFVVLFGGSLFGLIPSAAIAGVLIGTSFRIIDLKIIRELWKTNKQKFAVFITTAIVTIGVDLIWGIIFGVLVDLFVNKVLGNKSNATN
ncbi:MAG: hypothetical protein RLZZ330_41 [Actinomycetota bacterium]|jgi:SulP family sulfate permease